jgi:hypothetical protein
MARLQSRVKGTKTSASLAAKAVFELEQHVGKRRRAGEPQLEEMADQVVSILLDEQAVERAERSGAEYHQGKGTIVEPHQDPCIVLGLKRPAQKG